MIFVTVGTHEQQFDRLVEAVDLLKKENRVSQPVFIQTGYSKIQPQYCEYKNFISFADMHVHMAEAEIVITHGGTGSVMLVLYHGKIPVVVPRQHGFGEHIDDHQVIFCRTMETKKKILPIYDTQNLEECLNHYKEKVLTLLGGRETRELGLDMSLKERTSLFAEKLENICLELFKK